MSETKVREEICRLGRSLFERGLTPGSSGNISVRLDDGGWLVTPTNASLGSLDPLRLSRLDARRPAGLGRRRRPRKCRCIPRCTRRAAARARGGSSAFDAFGRALDAAGDRPARRAAADDGVLPDEVRRRPRWCPIIGPAIPRWRMRSRAWPENTPSVLLANHGPVVSGESLEAAVFAIEELEETAKLILLLRGMNPRYLTPAQIADLVKTFGLTAPEQSTGTS